MKTYKIYPSISRCLTIKRTISGGYCIFYRAVYHSQDFDTQLKREDGGVSLRGARRLKMEGIWDLGFFSETKNKGRDFNLGISHFCVKMLYLLVFFRLFPYFFIKVIPFQATRCSQFCTRPSGCTSPSGDGSNRYLNLNNNQKNILTSTSVYQQFVDHIAALTRCSREHP